MKKSELPRSVIAYLSVAVITTATIFYDSHDGGQLVYQYGVGTSVQPASS